MKISRGKIYKFLHTRNQTKKNKPKKRLGKRKHRKPRTYNKKKRKHLKNISLKGRRKYRKTKQVGGAVGADEMFQIVGLPEPKCDGKKWSEVINSCKYTDEQLASVEGDSLTPLVSLCIPEAKSKETPDVFKSDGPYEVQKSFGDSACGWHTVALYIYLNCIDGAQLTITPSDNQYPTFRLTSPTGGSEQYSRTNYYSIINSCKIGGRSDGESIFASTVGTGTRKAEELQVEWQSLLGRMVNPASNSLQSRDPAVYQNAECLNRENNFLKFVRKWRYFAMVKALADRAPVPEKYNSEEKIEAWKNSTDSFGGKDPYMGDADLPYVATLLQNTICVWNFNQGSWVMTTGIDRSSLAKVNGIAIPPNVSDNYPEPCMMLASMQDPAKQGGSINCSMTAQQMASVRAKGHFDFIRAKPDATVYNLFQTNDVASAGALLSNYTTQSIDYVREKMCPSDDVTDCKKYQELLKDAPINKRPKWEKFFEGNFNRKNMYVNYFKILGFQGKPSKDAFYDKINQLFIENKDKPPFENNGRRISPIFSTLRFNNAQLTFEQQKELIDVMLAGLTLANRGSSSTHKLDSLEDKRGQIQEQYEMYEQLYDSCNSESETTGTTGVDTTPDTATATTPQAAEVKKNVSPSAPVQPATEPQTQQLTQDGKCKALADKTEDEEDKLKKLNKLAEQGDKNAQKALKKEKKKALWSSFFPGYCSEKGHFVDYFLLLDVEKPNVESMSDEDFKGFVQKVNDAYLKHNNNDITKEIKGQKIRKAIDARESEKKNHIDTQHKKDKKLNNLEQQLELRERMKKSDSPNEEMYQQQIIEIKKQISKRKKELLLVPKMKTKLDTINKKHEKLIQKATNEPVTMNEFGQHVSSLHKKEEKDKAEAANREMRNKANAEDEKRRVEVAQKNKELGGYAVNEKVVVNQDGEQVPGKIVSELDENGLYTVKVDGKDIKLGPQFITAFPPVPNHDPEITTGGAKDNKSLLTLDNISNKQKCLEEARNTLTNKNKLQRYMFLYTACGGPELKKQADLKTKLTVPFPESSPDSEQCYFGDNFEREGVVEKDGKKGFFRDGKKVKDATVTFNDTDMLIGSCNERGKYVDYFKIFKTDSDELRPYIPYNKDSIEDSMLKQVTVGTVTTPIKPYEFLQEYQAGYESFKKNVNVIYKKLMQQYRKSSGEDEDKINQARIRCLNEARKVLRDENLYIDYMLHIYNACTKARKELETGLAQEETDFMQQEDKQVETSQPNTHDGTAKNTSEDPEASSPASADEVEKAIRTGADIKNTKHQEGVTKTVSSARIVDGQLQITVTVDSDPDNLVKILGPGGNSTSAVLTAAANAINEGSSDKSKTSDGSETVAQEISNPKSSDAPSDSTSSSSASQQEPAASSSIPSSSSPANTVKPDKDDDCGVGADNEQRCKTIKGPEDQGCVFLRDDNKNAKEGEGECLPKNHPLIKKQKEEKDTERILASKNVPSVKCAAENSATCNENPDCIYSTKINKCLPNSEAESSDLNPSDRGSKAVSDPTVQQAVAAVAASQTAKPITNETPKETKQRVAAANTTVPTINAISDDEAKSQINKGKSIFKEAAQKARAVAIEKAQKKAKKKVLEEIKKNPRLEKKVKKAAAAATTATKAAAAVSKGGGGKKTQKNKKRKKRQTRKQKKKKQIKNNLPKVGKIVENINGTKYKIVGIVKHKNNSVSIRVTEVNPKISKKVRSKMKKLKKDGIIVESVIQYTKSMFDVNFKK